MTSKYTVEPRSRHELRELALDIRKSLHLENEPYFPIVELLDVCEEVVDGFSYEIIEDDELPKKVHGRTDIATGRISIKESVYQGARMGNGRDRMTIAHEFAHFITLCFLGFKLYRTIGTKRTKVYEDPEWQAKCLAGELLIPHHLTKNMEIAEVMSKCGVSREAAKLNLSK